VGHGPKYYLSLSRTGERPLMEYVPNAYHDDVVSLLENHKKLRQVIDEICEINLEILRRRERLD
jgi:hypothetical protein